MSSNRFYILLGIGLAVLLLLTVVGYILLDDKNSINNGENEPELQMLTEEVRILLPFINETIASPVRIQGLARGFWYFEAQFPILITDLNGLVVGEAVATAKGDWMTEDFVAFEELVEFDSPGTDTGFIVFQRSNASGLPEHDQSLQLPVRFR